MKKIFKYTLSPVITGCLLLTLFYVFKLYPFAKNSISWCDMSQQVVPILLDFKNILDGKSNFLLNIQNAGGMSFWGIFFFFISSPFSFLVKFISADNMMLFMNVFLILKMMLCSFTASFYFLKRYKTHNWKFSVILGIMYAFSGYTMLFYQNIVWLDIMAMFPILLYSFEYMIEKRNSTLYIITFSFILLVNFYLSYMIVLFLVILFFFYLIFILQKSEKGYMSLLFICSSLISVLLSSPAWGASLFQYIESARTQNFIESLEKGGFWDPIFTNLACLMCTSIIFSALTILIPDLKNAKDKTKVIFWSFVICFVPVVIDPINKMWHTGSYQAFPIRYGYIPIFLGLILAGDIIENVKVYKPKNQKLAIAESSLFLVMYATLSILLITLFNSEITSYIKSLWVSREAYIYILLLFVIAFMSYFVYLYLFKIGRLSNRSITILMSILLFLECSSNSIIYITSAGHSINTYSKIIDLKDRIDDDEFYRVKLNKKLFDINMVGALGYPSLNHYTSFTCKDYMYALKKLGYSSYWMEINSTGGTKFTDALLCNKYVIGNANNIFENNDIIYNNSTFCIFKNKLSLPLGLKISRENALNGDLECINRFEQQEQIYSLMFDPDYKLFERFEPYNVENLNIKQQDGFYQLSKAEDGVPSYMNYEIEVGELSTLYFDCFSEVSNRLVEKVNGAFSISVNGQVIESYYPSKKNSGILELGTFENQKVHVELILNKDINCKSFEVYALNNNRLLKTLNSADKVNLNVFKNRIYGHCEANEDEYLYISMPFNEGYTAKVNNNIVPIEKVNGCFMKIRLQGGNNDIQIKYIPKGLYLSIIFLFIGIVCFVFFKLYFEKKSFKFNLISKLSYYTFISFYSFIILIIYIAPIIIFVISKLVK